MWLGVSRFLPSQQLYNIITVSPWLQQLFDGCEVGHIHGKDDARPDAARARPRREALGIKSLIEARRVSVAAKVGGGVAPVATLDPAAEICRRAAGNAARKHAETLRKQSVSNRYRFLLWRKGGLGRADVPA
jgi:hypothetical protein